MSTTAEIGADATAEIGATEGVSSGQVAVGQGGMVPGFLDDA
jgi:hypothetical protein